MTANEPALLRQCKGVRTTVSCRVWAAVLFGSFNTFVFLQTLLHSCATDFLLSNTTAAIATEFIFSAIAVVCSKHSPSTQQPQTQLRCVRLSFIAHYLNSKRRKMCERRAKHSGLLVRIHSAHTHTANYFYVVSNDKPHRATGTGV
jgi:hypothetical protein